METKLAIETIADDLRDEPSIRALFLSGSYGAGLEDVFSDIDFVLVAPEGPTDQVAKLWHRAISRTGEIVLWRDRQVGRSLINATTHGWLRIDVVISTPEQAGRQARDGLKLLFDHDQLFATLPASMEQRGYDPKRLRYQFEEFLRIFGLLPLVLGRKEYLNGVAGIFHLRNLLVDLMIEETGAPHRGGALHLNRLITDEQKQVLASLPPPIPERADLVNAHLAYAAAYLPRARRFAKQKGLDWPERFEAATWDHLGSTLGIAAPPTTA